MICLSFAQYFSLFTKTEKMLDVVILTVIFVATLFLAVIYYYMYRNKRVTTIPRPDPTTQEDGNLADISKAGSLHEYLLDLHQKYGDIAAFQMGKEMVVSICSPELFREHSNVFDRPASLFKLFEPFLGKKSIQYANKAEGKSRRKSYLRALGPSHLHYHYSGIQTLSDDMVRNWSSLGVEEHIPLNETMLTFALKLSIVSLFGSNEVTGEDIKEIRTEYLIAWNELERRLVGLSNDRSQRFENARNKFHHIVNELVVKRRTLRKKTDVTLLVDVLIDNTDDEEKILHDAISFTVAGLHTTGNLLTWALFYLSTYPGVQQKVYKEINRVLGSKDVDQNSTKDLKYLHQVINETFRCAAIAPWAARYQDVDSKLGGYEITKNTPVIHALGVSFQNEKYFPNPKRFDPDRFSEENIKSRPAYAFQPFGFAGNRMCPGYKLSSIGSVVLLVTILKKFRVNFVEGQVVIPNFGLVTRPNDEIWITLQKR